MNYIDFEVGNKTYKLRLNTRAIVLLEKNIGCNPLSIFGFDENNPIIPPVTTMVAILHAALQQYQHGININDAYDIFDAYLDEGKAPTDFLSVIIEIFQASGIMPKDKGNSELEIKNA
jgi:hypothetical protein